MTLGSVDLWLYHLERLYHHRGCRRCSLVVYYASCSNKPIVYTQTNTAMETWSPDPAGLAQILQTLRDSTNIHDKAIQQQITLVSLLVAMDGPFGGIVAVRLTCVSAVERVSTSSKLCRLSGAYPRCSHWRERADPIYCGIYPQEQCPPYPQRCPRVCCLCQNMCYRGICRSVGHDKKRRPTGHHLPSRRPRAQKLA